MKKPIELAFSFDVNYITPFLVLLASIFASNEGEEIYFHVALTNASTADKQQITQFIEEHQGKVWFYDIDMELVRSFAPPSERYGLATFYRLLLPGMMPTRIGKFIYLDVDILVVNNLRPLFDTEMETTPVGAVPEPVTYSRPDLDLNTPGEYFNAGILLINLPMWREQHIAERAIQFLKDYPEKVEYLDQDALNAVLAGNWQPLSDAYNFTWRALPPQASRSELQQLVATKTIIHFNTALKPWHRLSLGRLDYLYHDFFNKLSFARLRRHLPVEWNTNTVGYFLKMKVLKLYWDNPALGTFWRKAKKAVN